MLLGLASYLLPIRGLEVCHGATDAMPTAKLESPNGMEVQRHCIGQDAELHRDKDLSTLRPLESSSLRLRLLSDLSTGPFHFPLCGCGC